MQKFRFLLIVPVIALTWLVTACIYPPSNTTLEPLAVQSNSISTKTPHIKVGSIAWQGNTVYSIVELNKTLGLKTGDMIDILELEKRLNYNPGGQDISSLYMDKGYLFFTLEKTEKQLPDGSVDLVFSLSEGKPAHVRTIEIRGNNKALTQELLKQIPIKQGDLFSRTEIVEGQRVLATSGLVVSDKIDVEINPVVREGASSHQVDIAYSVIEK